MDYRESDRDKKVHRVGANVGCCVSPSTGTVSSEGEGGEEKCTNEWRVREDRMRCASSVCEQQ